MEETQSTPQPPHDEMDVARRFAEAVVGAFPEGITPAILHIMVAWIYFQLRSVFFAQEVLADVARGFQWCEERLEQMVEDGDAPLRAELWRNQEDGRKIYEELAAAESDPGSTIDFSPEDFLAEPDDESA